jgi:hypothetical protein
MKTKTSNMNPKDKMIPVLYAIVLVLVIFMAVMIRGLIHTNKKITEEELKLKQLRNELRITNYELRINH